MSVRTGGGVAYGAYVVFGGGLDLASGGVGRLGHVDFQGGLGAVRKPIFIS